MNYELFKRSFIFPKGKVYDSTLHLNTNDFSIVTYYEDEKDNENKINKKNEDEKDNENKINIKNEDEEDNKNKRR